MSEQGFVITDRLWQPIALLFPGQGLRIVALPHETTACFSKLFSGESARVRLDPHPEYVLIDQALGQREKHGQLLGAAFSHASPQTAEELPNG